MTTDITELAQRLKAAAEKLDGDNWHDEGASVYGGAYDVGDTVCYDHIVDCESVNGESLVAEFIALANPANILALVEALEKAQQRENEWKTLCEAAAVDLDDWSAIDDKSRELICKLADVIIAKTEQSAEWERKAISNFEDCAEMSARIEELESQRKLAFTASNRWADKFREAEKRIAELERLQEAVAGNSPAKDANAVKRLTITLPDTGSKAFWSGTGKTEIFLPVAYRRWVKEAIERYCAIALIDVEVK